MSAERWQKVKDIFGAALELRPDERHRFLAQACAGDEQLQSEVESLVASFECAADFIAAPVVEDTFKLLDEQRSKSVAGRRLGQYEIIRELGQGGMGAVYLALRADDQYQQQVAIKLVKQGFENQFIVQRFLAERQILANLDHPHIARLLDGGTTDDGAPYLVMEYIEGLPIDEYCDEHKLPTLERLKLFRTICSAVQYAHQNLVIHRDIKPSNILVTNDGTPKLLDFGIAKLLSPADAAPTVERTATALRLMTPDYASPEQVRGEPVTTSTDVYSLGVLLYKLLTGHHPYRFTTPLPQEIERVICEQEPERPSTAVAERMKDESGRMKKRMKDEGGRMKNISASFHPSSFILHPSGVPHPSALRGDLDNIVLMALRKEPARRYASVGEFSEDIQRHLAGLPVRARQDTFAYRGAKFIRRHKVGVAAAALMVMLLLAGIVATTWQARAAGRERDAARLEKAKAERINAFLQEMFASAAPETKGPEIKVVDLLDEAVQRAERELGAQPEVKAGVLLSIGKSFNGLRFIDKAVPVLRTALETSRAAAGENHPVTAASATHLARVLQSTKGNAHVPEAESLARQALAVQRRLYPAGHEDLAVTLYTLGISSIQKGDPKSAEPLFQEALEMCRKLFGHTHSYVAAVLVMQGHVREQQGDAAGAEAKYREAIAVGRQISSSQRIWLGQALVFLGAILTAKGNYAEAESALRESAQVYREVGGDSFKEVGVAIGYLGALFFAQGDYTPAEAELKKSVAIMSLSQPKESAELLTAKVILGRTLIRMGKAVEGEPLLRETLEIRKKLLPAGHWLIANSESLLGECLAAQKRYAEAEPLLSGAYKRLQETLGEQHQRTQEARQRLAQFHEVRHKAKLAARY
jgi:eukaryotic-like serine/threonine-protein kinase